MTKEKQESLRINTAIRLITETGFAITLSHPIGGGYDPDTGPIPATEELSLGHAIEEEWDVDSVPSSLATKIKKVISAVEINKPIVNDDDISYLGETYKVLGIKPLQPGEVLFLYEVYLGE